MALGAWISRGVSIATHNGRVIDTPAEARTVTPADLEWAVKVEKWPVVLEGEG